jgi:hypothetical protein
MLAHALIHWPDANVSICNAVFHSISSSRNWVADEHLKAGFAFTSFSNMRIPFLCFMRQTRKSFHLFNVWHFPFLPAMPVPPANLSSSLFQILIFHEPLVFERFLADGKTLQSAIFFMTTLHFSVSKIACQIVTWGFH